MKTWTKETPLFTQNYEAFLDTLKTRFMEHGVELHAPNQLAAEIYSGVTFVCVTDKDIAGIVRDALSVQTFQHDGSFLRFLFDGVRVDIYCVRQEELPFALKYLAYGSAGTIPGKLLHQMGMKLSVRGLFYIVREQMFDGNMQGGHILEEVPLTCEWSQALKLLSLDDSKWDTLQTQTELFKFISSSREFCPSIFVELIGTRIDDFPIRSNQLDIFISFCEWVKDAGFVTKGFRPRRVYRKGLFVIFPQLKGRMFANSGKFLRKREIYNKVNPALVRQWLALEDDDASVYNVLREFRTKHDELDILAMSSNEARACIVTYYQHLQQLQSHQA